MVVWIRSILVEITKKSSRFGWFVTLLGGYYVAHLETVPISGTLFY